jgi:hypothetical protein
MISQGDSVAVLMRESGVLKSTGQAYSIRGVQWFHLRQREDQEDRPDRGQHMESRGLRRTARHS